MFGKTSMYPNMLQINFIKLKYWQKGVYNVNMKQNQHASNVGMTANWHVKQLMSISNSLFFCHMRNIYVK